MRTIIRSSGRLRRDTAWPQSGGIMIQTGANEYIIAGTGIVVTFNAIDKGNKAGILQVDEGAYI